MRPRQVPTGGERLACHLIQYSLFYHPHSCRRSDQPRRCWLVGKVRQFQCIWTCGGGSPVFPCGAAASCAQTAQMSHFQSLSAPFVDKVSSSDGTSNSPLNNHYVQNNPAILQQLIASASSPGIRSKIAPIKYQRKKEEVSFEEGRRRALAATELALASPRTKAQFLEQELCWDGFDLRSQAPDRPSTEQYYAEEEQQPRDQQEQNYSLNSISSPVESEDSHISPSSPGRSTIHDELQSSPATSASHYTVKQVSPTRSLSSSSTDSSQSPKSTQKSGSARPPAERGANTPQQHLKKLRSVPERGSSNRNGSSQAQMATDSGLPAPGARPPGPRSSSIDSAINNIFSQNQNSERTPEEIAVLIQAAGSAESLIAHLLKDKAQAAAQNSQLWRLVDKQRSMILSLNRDLEKAMKDKERYRKKLKEQMNAVPPLPTGADVRSVISPTPSDAHDTDNTSQDGSRASIKELSRSDTFSTIDDNIAPYPVSPPAGGLQASSLQQEIMPDAEQHIIPPSDTRNGDKVPSKLDLSKSTNEPAAPTPGMPTPGLSRKRAPAPLMLQQSTQGYSVERPADETKAPAASDLTEEQARELLRHQEALISPGLPKKITLEGPDTIKSTTLTAPPRGLTIKGASNALKSPALGVGLPLSPRPIDRPLASPMFPPRQPRTEGRLGGPMSPPLSPRNGSGGLPLSPRFNPMGGPLSPAMLLPHGQSSLLTQAEQPVTNIHEQLMNLPQMASLAREVKQDDKAPGDFAKESNSLNGIAKGGDDRLLIVPPALQTIDARVLSTRMRARGESAKGRDQIVFMLAVYSRTNGNELWRVEKDVNTLGILDSQVRQFANPKTFNAKLPNMTLFTNHAPANIEGRRIAIEEYFVAILNTIPLDQRAGQALCEYLSVDVVDSTTGSDTASLHSNKESISSVPYQGDRKIKEGSLRKRGKNFGGWKSRHFVLDGPILRYFEHKGGSHLGSIRLTNAQIGKQSNSPPKSDNPEEGENQYRHAFLILEPKRNNPSSVIRHVFCAESDAERDEWVDCLLHYVHLDEHDDNASVGSDRRRNDDAASVTSERRKPSVADEGQPQPQDNLRAVSYENMIQGQAPIHGPPATAIDRRKDNPSPLSTVSTVSKMSEHGTAGGSGSGNGNGGGEKSLITGIASTLGGKFMANVAADAVERGKATKKKKGVFGFMHHKGSSDNTPPENVSNAPMRLPPSRCVFGASLGDAVEVSRPPDVDLAIPSVVYRSIEYLDARNACQEEGIFRLSGSNTTIKALRDRFNTNVDVDLLADEEEYHDVHAIAGLLKLYLRELPNNLLTRDLHGDFLEVLEDEDKINRINRLNVLVHQLPIENFTLLRLLASHLITVVENADVNKMTVKNVGIVFSPTLNIPAGVFSLFIMDYSSIFIRPGEEGYEEASYDSPSEALQPSYVQPPSINIPPMQLPPQQQQALVGSSTTPPPPTGAHYLAAPSTGHAGLPPTPRRMNFEIPSAAAEERRRQNVEEFRQMMETQRQEDNRSVGSNGHGGAPPTQNYSSGGALGGSMSLNMPQDKKNRRQSTMLGLFSSSKFSNKHKTSHEESPNPFDENSMYDV
ncbi:Rho-type GTPase-activating protein [Drechslerella dactyloides]|uniref:Rho-type GTPase-activating protein n=1 Tax=Drechslerella dactyloides TaxID=74499 RepID=A0AAD6J0V8_DREDA|nr:Rho-type GTPase-activating protein [Drechslerella dactyloides]